MAQATTLRKEVGGRKIRTRGRYRVFATALLCGSCDRPRRIFAAPGRCLRCGTEPDVPSCLTRQVKKIVPTILLILFSGVAFAQITVKKSDRPVFYSALELSNDCQKGMAINNGEPWEDNKTYSMSLEQAWYDRCPPVFTGDSRGIKSCAPNGHSDLWDGQSISQFPKDGVTDCSNFVFSQRHKFSWDATRGVYQELRALKAEANAFNSR